MVRPASIAIIALAVAGVARADAPAGDPAGPAGPAPLVTGQRSIGVGAEIGLNTGLGAALHLGTPQFGIYVASGIVPVLVFGNERDDTRSLTFDAYRAFALNADVYAMFLPAARRANVGISAGYSGNTVLGNGVNVGVAVRYELTEKTAFTVFGGLEVFPDAHDHLTQHGYPMTQDPSLPMIQGGANVGLVFYP